jgi:hypothetical protein
MNGRTHHWPRNLTLLSVAPNAVFLGCRSSSRDEATAGCSGGQNSKAGNDSAGGELG